MEHDAANGECLLQPELNEIVFPAGILQPPFFDPNVDDAMNYGSIGAVIGHEITHGFDDQGSRSDANGNLRNWWTADDRTHFNAKTDKLVKQYNECDADRRFAHQRQTDAGRKYRRFGRHHHRICRLSKIARRQRGPGDRRLHRAAAVLYGLRHKLARIDPRSRTENDAPHQPALPGRFRTLVPVSNVQAFYDAFNIKPGDKMYRPPEERVEVW